MIKITLDTNCIINLLDHTSESGTSVDEISEIIKYGLEGDVNIAITTKVESDLSNDKDTLRKNEIIKRIGMFPVVGTIVRLDFSKLDSGDVLAGDEQNKISEEVKKILFPTLDQSDGHFKNKINDVDHVVGHAINKRDIFVTDDKTILKKSETLKNSLNIVVMNPQKCLEYINLKANKIVLAQEFYEKMLKYKNLLINSTSDIYQNIEPAEYTPLRNWLLQKYPAIKDGLLRFKMNMMSVPFGNSQMSVDQGDILTLRQWNQKIQNLFIENNYRDQIFFFADCYNIDELRRYGGTETAKRKIEEDFKYIIDLLISYIGHLENKF